MIREFIATLEQKQKGRVRGGERLRGNIPSIKEDGRESTAPRNYFLFTLRINKKKVERNTTLSPKMLLPQNFLPPLQTLLKH
ncbi:hypothetical protein CEXT_371951 [Caerostris extrusa]|uniref:Uncharacterized protein n=1 Tax=Caerostris extrusa TaxID=172846 RepID=A0AAV4PFZ3_CAEEX|nr:hypothetical protein CEXT_371951 [Caerostris extrusa]